MEYVLILGGPLDDTEPTPLLWERIKKGKEFLDSHPDSKAIVSGGTKSEEQKLSEAEVMKNSLLKLGVDEGRIILENKAKTTYENFVYTRDITNENDSITFVTNKFHIWRSCKIMKKAKVNYTPLAAPNGKSSLSFRVRECFLRPLAFFNIIW